MSLTGPQSYTAPLRQDNPVVTPVEKSLFKQFSVLKFIIHKERKCVHLFLVI